MRDGRVITLIYWQEEPLVSAMQQCIFPTAVITMQENSTLAIGVGFSSTMQVNYRFSGREKVRLTSRRHGYMIDV